MFIDVHTHNKLPIKNSIYNVTLGIDDTDRKGWFSMGIHPWDLKDFESSISILHLDLKKNNPNFIFIGECGLDKVIDADFELQRKVFLLQVELSEKYMKPLIIHHGMVKIAK